MNIIDEETYLAMHGASRQGIGDVALHKNRASMSDKAWAKIINQQADKDAELIELRAQLRAEYRLRVESGELRPPTREERLISIAQGNPESESVKAARRLLVKRGVNWE